MKHLSKIDGGVYDISESCTFENGELKRDDITLVWLKDGTIAWYYGGYDFDTTEHYIRDNQSKFRKTHKYEVNTIFDKESMDIITSNTFDEYPYAKAFYDSLDELKELLLVDEDGCTIDELETNCI